MKKALMLIALGIVLTQILVLGLLCFGLSDFTIVGK